MLDLRWIRENPDAFDRALARRRIPPASTDVLTLDAERREAQTAFQELQQRRKALSREIGEAKRKGDPAEVALAEVEGLKDRVHAVEEAERKAGERLEALLATLPNVLGEDVPDGDDEAANVEIRRWGDPRSFDFPVRDHAELGERLGMDFGTASKMSGSRFVLLRGQLARFERALAAFMLDVHTSEFGYEEIRPPLLLRDDALFGTGQLPKFAEDLFRTEEGYWLLPTAEVPMTNIVAGEIVDGASLPLRFTAQTPCFRSEAGAAGRDTRGMIRQHQFEKVELVSVTRPEDSEEEHERMTACAEEILKRLGLPFRTVVLSSGDTGFSARKTYDIEVWLPGQGAYREISSCSNCGDFQARRMNARMRREEVKGTEFVHTLNGSGMAIGRTMIALIENGQREDGSIVLPETLRPYTGFDRLVPDA